MHEFELLAAPVEILEPEVVPHPLGAPEHRAVHGLGLPVTGGHAHRAAAASRYRLLDSAVDRDGRHSSNMIKVFPPNERWLTVYGEHPQLLRNSRLTSRSGRTAGARPA